MAKEVKLNNPISASCPSCANPMRIPRGMKRGYCPKCGAGLRVARENPIERYHGGLIRKLDKGKWEVTFGTYAGDATKVYLKKAWAQEALRNWQDDYRPSGGYVVDKNQRLY